MCQQLHRKSPPSRDNNRELLVKEHLPAERKLFYSKKFQELFIYWGWWKREDTCICASEVLAQL
jgi:hypothetical protein